MPGWLGYVLYFLIILVAIAPKQALGPVFGAVNRYVGPGVVAIASLAVGSYALGVADSERSRWIGFGELGLGAICAMWWIYRQFVPRYRDQAPASEPVADDR